MTNTNPRTDLETEQQKPANQYQLNDFLMWLIDEGIFLAESGSGYEGFVMAERRGQQLITDYLNDRGGKLDEPDEFYDVD